MKCAGVKRDRELCYTLERMMRGGHGGELVIKKCDILASELSVVSWGIYLWRAVKQRGKGVGDGEGLYSQLDQ